MRLVQNPFFRKVIVPWYDSETACIISIVVMLPVLLFGFAGVSVALEFSEYRPNLWFPILLVTMSGMVAVSTGVRLIRRYLLRFSK